MTRFLLVFFILFAAPLSAQEPRNIPDAVIHPYRLGEGRPPRDTVIGDLGRGDAPEEAYRAARNVLAAVQRNSRDSSLFRGFNSLRLEELLDGVAAVSPERFRVGGGKIMPDGSVSFLFRFIGREKGVAGELYLRQDRPVTAAQSTAPPPSSVPAESSGTAAVPGTAAPADGDSGAGTPVETAQSVTPTPNTPPTETAPAAASTQSAAPAPPPSSAPAEPSGTAAVPGAATPADENGGTGTSAGTVQSATPAPDAVPAQTARTAAYGVWYFDDLLLDEAHDTQVRREVYPYDFTPYERFY